MFVTELSYLEVAGLTIPISGSEEHAALASYSLLRTLWNCEKAKISVEKSDLLANKLASLELQEASVELSRRKRHEVNKHVEKRVIDDLTSGGKNARAILHWGIGHFTNVFGVEIGQKLIDKFGAHSFLRVGLFGTIQEFEEYLYIFNHTGIDAPSIAIITQAGFGNEVAFYMPEKMAYYRSHMESLRQ